MTNKYIDSVNGSDSYDGTSPVFTSGITGPYRTLQKARNYAYKGVGNNRIYLENGSSWVYDPMTDPLAMGVLTNLYDAAGGIGNPNKIDMRAIYPDYAAISNYDRTAAATDYDLGVKKSARPKVTMYHDAIAGEFVYKNKTSHPTFGMLGGAGYMGTSSGAGVANNTLTLSSSALGAYFDIGMDVSGIMGAAYGGGASGIRGNSRITAVLTSTTFTIDGAPQLFTAASETALIGLHRGYYFNFGTTISQNNLAMGVKYGEGFTNWIKASSAYAPNDACFDTGMLIEGRGHSSLSTYSDGYGYYFLSSPNADPLPGGVDPVTYYGGLRMLIGNFVYFIDRGQQTVVENIYFENVGCCIRLGCSASTNPTVYGSPALTIRGCHAESVAMFSYTAQGVLDLDGLSCWILNNTANDFGVFAHSYGGPSVNGPSATNCKTYVIDGNVMTGGSRSYCQGAIYMSMKAVNMTQRVSNNKIYNTDSGFDNGSRWSEAGAIYCDFNTHNMTISGNYIDGANTGLQDNSGGTIIWRGNVCKNVRTGQVMSANNGSVGAATTNMTVDHNTFILKDDYEPRQQTSPSSGPVHHGGAYGTITIGTIKFTNNIVVADPNFNYNAIAAPMLRISHTTATVTGNYSAPLVGNVGFGLKASTGVGAIYNAGINFIDPLLNDDGKLAAGSPCINPAAAVGQTPGVVDGSGFKYKNPPSIGGYEYRPITTKAKRV